MKRLFKNKLFKSIIIVICCLLAGGFLSSALGHNETVQSSVFGVVLEPFNFVAQKISDGLDKAVGAVKGDSSYEKKIEELENEVGDLRSQLVDCQNLKNQNDLYKEFLELKEEHKDYEFVEASVIGRDNADIYGSFTLNQGSATGIKEGDAVLYGKYIIGVIDKAYPTYSVVRTVLDPELNISAYEIVSGEISYVTGNAKLAKDGKCKFANLSSTTNVTYGSIICTAGISGTVPKGLIVGTVEEISDETTDISSYAVITPGVEIDDVASCFVLTGFNQ